MKHTKRLLALVMSALLALPLLCMTALAQDDTTGTTYTFVVNNKEEGYTYVLYQMFTGDVTTIDDEYVLSNVEWGSSVPTETQSAMYSMFGLSDSGQTAARVAEEIAGSNNSDLFHSMMSYMAAQGKTGGASLQPYKYLEGPKEFAVNGETKTGYGLTGLPAGYYLVRNTGVPANDSDAAYSDYIIEVAGADVFAEPKTDTAKTIKKLKDVNDSSSSGLTDWQDSADYDIGDTIPYELVATLPQNFSAFSTYGYSLKFEDDLCPGLTWDGTATIYYGSSDTTGTSIKFEPVTGMEIEHDGETETINSAYTDGTVWMYDCGDLLDSKRNLGLTGGDTIRVEYTATLNENASVGPTGNANRHRIIFSNNPTNKYDFNASSYDLVKVFTYATVFTKVDDDGEPLSGADFTLEKKVGNEWVDVTKLHTGAGARNPTKSVSGNGSAQNVFTFSGLDDGDYRLRETTTPAGYNTMDDQEFTISATHDASSDEPKLISLSGTDGKEFTMKANMSTATLSAEIENYAGVVLPTSGGAGTKLIYTAGVALVVVSMLVINRKRIRSMA